MRLAQVTEALLDRTEKLGVLLGMEAHCGLCQCTSVGHLSCSVSWFLDAFFRPCICTFVQHIYVVKLSYILSLHGPGHRSCPGSYYKIFLGKKARGIFVGCWPWVYPSVFCGWVSSYALKVLKLQSEGTDFEITTTHASGTHSSENGPVFSF